MPVQIRPTKRYLAIPDHLANFPYYFDVAISEGIATTDAYDSAEFPDRIFDIRLYKAYSIALINPNPTTSTLNYTILGATKDFDDDGDLVLADFTEIIKAETDILPGASSDPDSVKLETPEITAIMLRVKGSGAAGRVVGNIKFN